MKDGMQNGCERTVDDVSCICFGGLSLLDSSRPSSCYHYAKTQVRVNRYTNSVRTLLHELRGLNPFHAQRRPYLQ